MESSGTRIGTEIAGFRIESVLGRGGMSVVYLAEQTRLGRKVALKILASGLLERDESFRNRFLQESHVAAGLDHPNIIPIFDAGEEDGCLYIAMRYVEGRDLGQILEQEGPLGLGRTIFILDQVAGALDAAHEHGLVHRDVKPANILLVGNTDRLYLTDFGVAKPTTSAGLTRTGFFIGTPDYSAPEQIEGKEVDARTDVYALGGMLYSCLTGLAPYARDTEVGVLQAHLQEPPPKLRQQRPDLPRGLDRVIATAMAKSKDDRYLTCGDLLAAAEAAARERPTTFPAVDITVIVSPEPDAPEAIGSSETVLTPDSVAPLVAAVQASATEPAVIASTAPVKFKRPALPALTRRSMIAVAVAAVLVVAGAVIPLVLLSGGKSAKPAAAGSTNLKLTALEQAVVRADTSVIGKGKIPLSRCHDQMLRGGIERLSCPNAWTDVSAVLLQYPSLKALYAQYHRDLAGFRTVSGNALASNSGNCIGSGAIGEAAWRHPPDPVQTVRIDPTMPASMAKRGWEGRVFCGESSSQPFQFEWTFDPGLLLGIATSLDHNDVWVWWHSIHHNLVIGSMSMPMPATKGTSFHVALASSAEVPTSISNTRSGTAEVTIDGTNVCWAFKLSGVDKPIAAHIHQGGSSVSGPVVVPLMLNAMYKPTGCTTTTAAAAKAILANPSAYYVNVHTAKYPDGVVRGQL
jgi:serine/threonine protein kinase